MPTTSPFSAPGPDLWDALGWMPNEQQQTQFKALQAELLRWNARVNLTRLLEGEEFWVSQILDSLWPLQAELQTASTPRRCIDVGTGGGFPGLAVAIALPGASLTLVDSVGRKTAAVLAMADAVGLKDRVQIRTERVELTGRDPYYRGSFDLAMARATIDSIIRALEQSVSRDRLVRELPLAHRPLSMMLNNLQSMMALAAMCCSGPARHSL